MPSLAGAALADGLAADAHHASFLEPDAASPWPGHPQGARSSSGGALEELGGAAAAALAARRSASAAFLAPAEGRGAATSTSFFLGGGKQDPSRLPKTPKLGKLRLYLMYQTPEIYKTDIGEQKLPWSRGWKYACTTPDRNGFGKAVSRHPSIVFNSIVSKVHVHMEDKSTGNIFWDADYDVPRNLMWAAMGKSKLPSSAPALNGAAGKFRQPCVPRDDPTTHQYEITIQTQDGYYDDNATPWAENEGFGNFAGFKAHIGFDAKRFPLLVKAPGGFLGVMNSLLSGSLSGLFVDPGAPQKEVVGEWMRGGNYSRGGPTHHDRHDRVLAGEEDPFYDDSTGRSYRGYYYHIIKPSGRQRNMYEYLDKNAPPTVYSFPGQRSPPEKKGFLGGVGSKS